MKNHENCEFFFAALCTYDLTKDEPCNGVCERFQDIAALYDIPPELLEK